MHAWRTNSAGSGAHPRSSRVNGSAGCGPQAVSPLFWTVLDVGTGGGRRQRRHLRSDTAPHAGADWLRPELRWIEQCGARRYHRRPYRRSAPGDACGWTGEPAQSRFPPIWHSTSAASRKGGRSITWRSCSRHSVQCSWTPAAICESIGLVDGEAMADRGAGSVRAGTRPRHRAFALTARWRPAVSVDAGGSAATARCTTSSTREPGRRRESDLHSVTVRAPTRHDGGRRRQGGAGAGQRFAAPPIFWSAACPDC